MSQVFVTGFGQFGPHESNPSGWLAENLGFPFRVLEVKFAALDAFYADPSWQSCDVLLHLGLHGGAKHLHLEQFAFNEIGPSADNDGVVLAGAISPGSPRVLGTSLLPHVAPSRRFKVTYDAGRYLCNAIYYRSLLRFPEKRIGFVHVPPPEQVSLEAQLAALRKLIDQALA